MLFDDKDHNRKCINGQKHHLKRKEKEIVKLEWGNKKNSFRLFLNATRYWLKET